MIHTQCTTVSVQFSDTGGKSGLLQIWQCLRQPGCLQKQKMYFFCKKEDIRKVQIVSFPHSQKQQWLKSTDCQAQQQQRQSLCQYLLNSLTHSHSSPTKTAIISDHWSKITTIISDHWSHIMAVLVSHHHNVLISSWIIFLFFVFFPVSVCPYETATVSDHNDVMTLLKTVILMVMSMNFCSLNPLKQKCLQRRHSFKSFKMRNQVWPKTGHFSCVSLSPINNDWCSQVQNTACLTWYERRRKTKWNFNSLLF